MALARQQRLQALLDDEQRAMDAIDGASVGFRD